MSTLFSFESLSFSYPESSACALQGVTLRVEEGEFLVLCGPSGGGKSTLLRQCKPALTPHGRRGGAILFDGAPLEDLSPRRQAQEIGFVLQSPDNQLVTDKVWHELAFGMESLGFDDGAIRRRVAEMTSFFGMEDWFHRDVAALSGGQKQLLNLAAVMTLQPRVLILDEPTSQLDPIAAADFLAVLGRINRELGTTVILSEHRLEESLALATAAAVLDRGVLLAAGTPAQVGQLLREQGHGMFQAMPAAMRIWSACGGEGVCPVTVRDGRRWLERYACTHPLRPLPPERIPARGDAALQADGVWFRYEKESADVVRGVSFTAYSGELLAILGGNGAGKTTTLKLLAGLLPPYRGQVTRTGRTGLLPQDPQTLFVKKTVQEDLEDMLRSSALPPEEQAALLRQTVSLCHLADLLAQHPYDLSGGEQQRAALGKVLLAQPDILLLDEPTKGLDAAFKETLAEILASLCRQGKTVVMVSHDVEFCAAHAHRCALFFDGAMAAQGTPRAFFSGNSFYTTSSNRMARQLLPGAVTVEDVLSACGAALPAPAAAAEESTPLSAAPAHSDAFHPAKLPWWRKALAAVSSLAVLAVLIRAMRTTNLTALVGGSALSPLAWRELGLYGVLIVSLLVLIAAIARRSPPPQTVQLPREKRKLRRRTVVSAGLILLLIPLTLLAGGLYLEQRKYMVISLLILLECMAPFFLVFEGRRPQPRELVLIAVLCAIGVAGRAAFFMLPQFKPVTALTIIAGVALGGETGFLVGAMTMLCSNVLFSQGVWTPWQMFCMGLIGFLAGVLFRKGWLRRSRGALAVFGAAAVFVIYGGIINPAGALLFGGDSLNWKIVLTYYITGFPMDCIHAAATFFFLWLCSEPMLEKLDRIKVKYGLVE